MWTRQKPGWVGKVCIQRNCTCGSTSATTGVTMHTWQPGYTSLPLQEGCSDWQDPLRSTPLSLALPVLYLSSPPGSDLRPRLSHVTIWPSEFLAWGPRSSSWDLPASLAPQTQLGFLYSMTWDCPACFHRSKYSYETVQWRRQLKERPGIGGRKADLLCNCDPVNVAPLKTKDSKTLKLT